MIDIMLLQTDTYGWKVTLTRHEFAVRNEGIRNTLTEERLGGAKRVVTRL